MTPPRAHTAASQQWRGARVLVLLLLGVVLTACGSHTPSADEIQQQFIAAIQHNDQPAMLRLVAPTALYTVGDIPVNIYDATVEPHRLVTYKPTGPFQRVEVEAATARGAVMVSKSLWHWQAAVECYDTTLAKFPEGWQVISIYRSDRCP